MAESLLDVDLLVAPIPGDRPEGTSLPFAIRKKLEEARKEVNPAAFAADDPLRPSQPVLADWDGIRKLAEETLTRTSKDLLVAARLVEALVKTEGFPGLHGGLVLLRRLVDECWERLSPPIEDGDLGVREAAFNWLDDPDRGARFPQTVRGVPLLRAGDKPCSLADWMQAQNAKDSEAIGVFDRAIAATPRDACQAVADEVTASLAELELLIQSLTTRMGEAAAGLAEVRRAVNDCQQFAQQILGARGPPRSPLRHPRHLRRASRPAPTALPAGTGAAA